LFDHLTITKKKERKVIVILDARNISKKEREKKRGKWWEGKKAIKKLT